MHKMMITAAVAALSLAALATAKSTPTGFTEDLDAAIAKAAKNGKTVVAVFSGSDWCCWCQRLEQKILSQPAFTEAAYDKYELVFIDSPRDKSIVGEELAKKNRELTKKYAVRGFPTVLLFNGKGEKVGQTGYRDLAPAKYVEHLDEIIKSAPLKEKFIKPIEAALDKIQESFRDDINKISEGGESDETTAKVNARFSKLADELEAMSKKFAAETSKVDECVREEYTKHLAEIDKTVQQIRQACEAFNKQAAEKKANNTEK